MPLVFRIIITFLCIIISFEIYNVCRQNFNIKNSAVNSENVEYLQSFRAGDNIIHPDYGVGTVENLVPQEGKGVYIMYFRTVGRKTVDTKTTPIKLAQ